MNDKLIDHPHNHAFGWQNWLKLAGFLAPLVLVAWIFFTIEDLYLPFLLSFLLFYMLDPLVNYGERYHIPRPVGILVLFALIGGGLIWSIVHFLPFIIQEIKDLPNDIPIYIANLEARLLVLQKKYSIFKAIMAEVDLQQRMAGWVQLGAVKMLGGFTVVAKSIFMMIAMVPLISFILLNNRRDIKHDVLQLVPNRYFELTLYILHKINTQLGEYIRGKVIESFIVGAVIALGLYFLDIKYYLLLGIIGGLTNLIPYLGPIIGAIPGVMLAVLQHEGASVVYLAILVYLLARLVDDILIVPTVIARTSDLHPLLVITAVVIGEYFMGILGMIIFIPIVSIFKIVIMEVYRGLKSLKH